MTVLGSFCLFVAVVVAFAIALAATLAFAYATAAVFAVVVVSRSTSQFQNKSNHRINKNAANGMMLRNALREGSGSDRWPLGGGGRRQGGFLGNPLISICAPGRHLDDFWRLCGPT